MATAGDIIEQALLMARVRDPGESIEGQEIAQNLKRLNLMLDKWSLRRLTVYVTVEDNVAMVAGTRSYTIGTGATWNTVRPVKIEQAFIRIDNLDYPLTEMNEQDYNDISIKNISAQPSRFYYKADYPLGTVYLDYTPDSAYDTYLYSWKPFTAFADVTTSFSFPPGYEIAMTSNLAVVLGPSYGRSVPDEVKIEADDSLNLIKATNLVVPDADFSDIPTAGRGGGASIYSPRV